MVALEGRNFRTFVGNSFLPSFAPSDSATSAPSFLLSAVTALGRNLYLGATWLVGFVLFVAAGHYKFLLPTPLMSPFSAMARQTDHAGAGWPSHSRGQLLFSDPTLHPPPLPQTSHLYEACLILNRTGV